MTVCPACRRENPDDARFCSGCATPLAAEPAPAREERKVVTVLFCDLVGFTGRAESMDPEDVRALLSGYHERVRSELERHGGTVEKFVGDAVMALFGAPSAHEDDPERAVRAALAIRDEIELTVRIGITTGEVLVTLGGEPTAAGDVVNTASRLQSAAPENGILVDEATYRATGRAIEYRESEPVQAKGKAEPVPAWEAVEARSRLEVDVRRPRAPLVGRKRELGVLVDALARVRDERSPQLVTLVGEPGIGKSRLVFELFQAVEAEPELITWRQGRSLPYGEGVSYWALGEMVKVQAGVLESDPPEAAEEKLEAAVAGMADADWIAGHLRPLAGLGGEAETGADQRSEAFTAWRRFFEELAEQRTLVLVFEDLHWADDGLLDFVDHLVDWASGVPILVVASARPELLERRAGWWGGGKRNATTISLAPLGEEDTARLIAALLERALLPAEIQAALLQRAGGNPLYAEEFSRMMGERGRADQVRAARELGLRDLEARALNALGVARVSRGDHDGLADLERSLTLAHEIGSPMDIARAYGNIASITFGFGELEQSTQAHIAFAAAAERWGMETATRWSRGERPEYEYHAGRWDDALRGASDFIAEIEAGAAHYQEAPVRAIRSLVQLGRGEPDGALADDRRSVELGRSLADPQVRQPALAVSAFVQVQLGDPYEALRRYEELVSLWRADPGGSWFNPSELAFAAVGLDRPSDFLDAAAGAPSTRWLEAACVFARGDYGRAAALYREIGSLPNEAYAWLAAGEPADLERALSFHRSVGAVHYVRQAEAQLARTA